MNKEEAEQEIQVLEEKLVKTTGNIWLYHKVEPWIPFSYFPPETNLYILQGFFMEENILGYKNEHKIWFKVLYKNGIYYTGFTREIFFSKRLKEV
jgi:hypothetical protein